LKGCLSYYLHENIDEKVNSRIEEDERMRDVFDNDQTVRPDSHVEPVVAVPELVDGGDHPPDVTEEK